MFLALLLTVFACHGCARLHDQSLSPDDLIFERYPGNETVLRLKVPCPVLSDDGSRFILPIGDYDPVAADTGGLFYEAPLSVELKRGDQSAWLFGLGVYFPSSFRSISGPYLWVESVTLERGTLRRVKRWALPEQCWKPYGSTIAIVHNGAEISQDD